MISPFFSKLVEMSLTDLELNIACIYNYTAAICIVPIVTRNAFRWVFIGARTTAKLPGNWVKVRQGHLKSHLYDKQSITKT